MTMEAPDFTVERLGPCTLFSPLPGGAFTPDDERVLFHTTLADARRWFDRCEAPPSMEAAGPRERIFFDPATLGAGIVTCGGLCPGINDVIRSIVLSLHHHYGVRRVYGFRYGYEGLVAGKGQEPLPLTAQSVARIHEAGGTVLGTSRGPQDPAAMVDTLERLGIGILFAIGGDGTLRGAGKIAEEVARRGRKIAVVGIPKTIDNDVQFVQQTFGFETAVTEAWHAISAANTEAESARNGVGLVKLMGRDSGFIAAYATLASGNVNFCLVPEVPFTMERFLREMELRLERRGHAVVVVAEGAGQDLMAGTQGVDASGNARLGDIGTHLRDAVTAHFKARKIPLTLKYIDPSYTIRSVPAGSHDSVFCLLLGHMAVHAGMSGRTNLLVGFWNQQFTHVPIPVAVTRRKTIDPADGLWNSVLLSTGQVRSMT